VESLVSKAITLAHGMFHSGFILAFFSLIVCLVLTGALSWQRNSSYRASEQQWQLLAFVFLAQLNPLMGTLKPQSNKLLYRNTMIGTLAFDGWAVTFGTARRGLSVLRPRPVPPLAVPNVTAHP